MACESGGAGVVVKPAYSKVNIQCNGGAAVPCHELRGRIQERIENFFAVVIDEDEGAK